MSKIYAGAQRRLQDRFDTRRLADLLEEAILHAEFTPEEKSFIEARDMVVLSTTDAFGRPTVSYKGGAPGFVRITGPSTLIFSCYDGNGMYYSAGNLDASSQVGLLFIDLERPHRLRVHGTAAIRFDHPVIATYPGAEFLVEVEASEIWVNCSRYIHRYEKVQSSKNVPTVGEKPPFATWKRVDVVQGALPARDRGGAENVGGQITGEEYQRMLADGTA